jgi:3',5'-cyclic AMP phosphodiesterase CpdA
MTRLVLCADLHFGSVPEGLADTLRATIEGLNPGLVIVAGDLTLAARTREFEEAKAWLAAITPPTLVLPGNHDLPYWNILQRFADPFHRFRQATSAETLMPAAVIDGAFVLGFNTTGSWQPHLRWQEGVARRRDIAAAKLALDEAPSSAFKAVAGHHPFIAVSSNERARPVRRAHLALEVFSAGGVELLMSGHTHLSFAIEAETACGPVIAVGAPTALSSRMRGEQNGFWLIEVGSTIECELWLRGEGDIFRPQSRHRFQRRPGTNS